MRLADSALLEAGNEYRAFAPNLAPVGGYEESRHGCQTTRIPSIPRRTVCKHNSSSEGSSPGKADGTPRCRSTRKARANRLLQHREFQPRTRVHSICKRNTDEHRRRTEKRASALHRRRIFRAPRRGAPEHGGSGSRGDAHRGTGEHRVSLWLPQPWLLHLPAPGGTPRPSADPARARRGPPQGAHRQLPGARGRLLRHRGPG